MAAPRPIRIDAAQRIAELEARLAEAEETLDAIRNGDVDGLVVRGPEGERVFTLAGAEHPYRVLVEAMNEGAATLDATGVVLWANARLAQLRGLPLEKIVGSAVRDHVAPSDGAAIEALLASARAAGIKAEVALRAGERGTVPVQLSVAPVPSSPEVLGVVFTDLSEIASLRRALQERDASLSLAERELAARERTQRALRRSEGVLRHAGELAHLGAWWIEFEGAEILDSAPLRWSAEVYRIFGYEPGTVEPSQALFFEHVHPDDRERVRDVFVQAVGERRPYHVEHRIVLRDGSERVVLEHAEFAVDPSGRLHMTGAVQDVTDQKRTEAALREADRRKDEFLGVLSHELRNPLAPMRNALYILDRSEPGSDGATRAREIMERQVDHLARLVDDLLDVTRIVRGKIRLQNAALDLCDVVRRTAEDHRPHFGSKHVELQVDVPAAPLPVHGDVVRIAQVLGNLLHNAVKFTPAAGRVAVTVARDGDVAVVGVRDSGVGFPPQLRERLFDPFFQAEEGLSRSLGGLGLGLTLAKGFVELHGGTIDVQSEGPGRGTEVVVRLPLAAEPLRDRPARAERGPAARRRVLVIEDNSDGAETLRMMLEMEGHEVAVAHDGLDGLARARAFRPEVVLCDIGLPEMDGFAVARALRDDGALRSSYLVALTGYALPEDQRRAAEAGFDLHLAKPPTVAQLQDALARAPGGEQG
jgi:PAS domain S-box-containing protein